MITHDTARTWGERFGDRLLGLLSTKFILGILGLAASSVLTWSGKMDGASFALVVLGLAGVHGVANAAIEGMHAAKEARLGKPRASAVARPRRRRDGFDFDDEDDDGLGPFELEDEDEVYV